jgi:CDP-diacylglycerol--glycerol-3-phosphate 3-phosphatidyltransferase
MNVVMTQAQQNTTSDGPSNRLLTIPNALCMIRLLGAFVLPVLAVANQPVAFVITYLVLTSTDWIDGKLARWLNQTSKIGPKLDTVADVTMYGGLLFGLVWLYGGTLVSEAMLLGTGLVSYAGSCLASLIKFRRLPSYHTRAAKISWFVVLIAVVALFLDWSIWPLRVACMAVVLTNLESILITVVLPKKQNDVPSIFHAILWPKQESTE